MATRYWVGGTDTWDGISDLKWALTSGGIGGQLAPTSADTVFFDAASGANVVTIGNGYNPSISTLTMTSFTGTLAFGSQNISVGGTGTIYTGATTFSVTGTPVINCTNSTATARTINPSATTEANAISFNITAGTGSFTITGSSVVKNLDFTGFTGSLGANSRILYGSLTLGSGMTSPDGTTVTFFASTLVQQNITINGVSFGGGITLSGTQTVQLQDNLTLNSTRTFTLTSGTLDLKNNTLTTGLFGSTNSNTRSIVFGTGKIILIGNSATIWSANNMNGFTYTGTSNIEATYSGATGTRTILSGSSTTESNALNFKISAGIDTVAVSSVTNNLDFTGFSGTLTNATRIIYGNLTFSSGMTLTSGIATITMGATSGTQQITTAGKTLDFPLAFNGIGGTFAFQDALTQGSTRAFTITNGTVQFKNGVASTVGAFTTSGTNQKFLQSTLSGSQATLSQASGTVDASYLTIKDINATSGAVWNARTDLGSKDLGNNTGWNFIYIAIQQILKSVMQKILKPIILN